MSTASSRERLMGQHNSFRAVHLPPDFDFAFLLKKTVGEEASESESSASSIPPSRHDVDHARQVNPLKRPAQDAMSSECFTESPSPLKKQSRRNFRRARKREANIQQFGHMPRPSNVDMHTWAAHEVKMNLITEQLPAANGGYNAKNSKVTNSKKVATVKELKEDGFTLIEAKEGESVAILDHEGRIIAVFAWPPIDHDFGQAIKGASEVMLREGRSTSFKPDEIHHTRGAYPAINVGLTYGNGAPAPMKMNNRDHKDMAARLLSNEHICRLAHHQSAMYAFWNPEAYLYTKEYVDRLHNEMKHLPCNFKKSIFPTAAFNLGPRVCTFKHRDVLNLPFGWCAIHALGNFDHTKGGHLILWELKLILEFPPGCIILLPSAIVTHSNTPVAENETRLSFTQYCLGALCRYVDNDFQTEDNLKKVNPAKYEENCRLKTTRWKMGLGFFSTLEDLRKRKAIEALTRKRSENEA